MRTLKHSLQRRNHRERAQPVERQKWGLLEKPKDYRLRALDYRSKQLRLKRLREKAAERNPDEFYFGMMREKTKDGIVYVSRGNPVLSEENVRLLKTQDSAYIKTMQRIENERIKKLEERIQMNIHTTSDRVGKHYYFMDEVDLQEKHDKEQKNQDTCHQMLEKSTNELFKFDSQTETALDQNDVQFIQTFTKSALPIDSKLVHELESRKARAAQLSVLAKHIDLHRNLQTKGERKKVGTSQDGVPIYKWKLERKK
ncbi:rRNA-processing protein UTP11 [Pneumocystis jirovecii RU7]|uniref:U3 small nucleolar RNA-associated protein 11 n=1 Tax=Pneumocystis jirovecii (strain RU7) TaxID=1408657 RepID=A0A0W4ZVA5_PNEJ7|nr:rRNA-processing protein UTP11 [Pneumocystis jirovecii RU7]KTW32275.1 hypothetical protein T551_00366 [Pneumocystis jirovecii RU7]